MPAATTLPSPARRKRRAGIWILSWRSWRLPLVLHHWFRSLSSRGSTRRRQLTVDSLRVMGEPLGDAARHLSDIAFFLAGLEPIEAFRRSLGRPHLRYRQPRCP